jgi:uncharacterized protein (TIGR03437 family)
MSPRLHALAALLLAGTLQAAPAYTAASIVNAADNLTGPLAPNTIATIYGTGLAYGTKSLTASDIRGGVLPTVLPGTGVRVSVGGIPANLYYVSPLQINFLVPPLLGPGLWDIQVSLDSLNGPSIQVELKATSPAFFQLDAQNAVSTRDDGSTITPDNPVKPGDDVVLYCAGLGETIPRVYYLELPTAAAPLRQLADLKLMLDGVAIDAIYVTYAGVAPGFAGLYQVNVKLPATTGSNPEIRIGFGDQLSKPGLRLPVQSLGAGG